MKNNYFFVYYPVNYIVNICRLSLKFLSLLIVVEINLNMNQKKLKYPKNLIKLVLICKLKKKILLLVNDCTIMITFK